MEREILRKPRLVLKKKFSLRIRQMRILHDLYGLSTDDTRYRSKLKARIQSEFTDKLHFVFINGTTPEVLISTESIKSRVLFNDKEHLLNQAAE